MAITNAPRYKQRVADRDGLFCYFCEYPYSLENLTLEHLIPIKRGGSQKSLNNHALACSPCNNEKGGLTVVEYALYLGYDPSLFPLHGELRVYCEYILPPNNPREIQIIKQIESRL
jgi:HNH endonuclease